MRPFVGEIWRHGKTGNDYRIINLVIDEATKQPAVTYQREDKFDPRIWVRPTSEWMEKVTYRRDGELVSQPRFMKERSAYVVKMPHVPMQTAKMVAERIGLDPRRILADECATRGLPAGDIHIIEVRNADWGFYEGNMQRDHRMERELEPYLQDSRYCIVRHDCDTVIGVKR